MDNNPYEQKFKPKYSKHNQKKCWVSYDEIEEDEDVGVEEALKKEDS